MFQTLKFLKKSGPAISKAIHGSYNRCLVPGLLSPTPMDVVPSSLSQVSAYQGVKGELHPSKSERAIEATRHGHLIFIFFASCIEMQVLTLLSRSSSSLRSKLRSLTGNSPARAVFRDPSVSSVPQVHTRKRAVSAGHAQSKASFPQNNLPPRQVLKEFSSVQ